MNSILVSISFRVKLTKFNLNKHFIFYSSSLFMLSKLYLKNYIFVFCVCVQCVLYI